MSFIGVMKEKDETRNNEGICDYIPFDLIREIFLRLSAKSLIRFRCLSKLWFSIIINHNFVNSFLTQSAARPCLQFTFATQNNIMMSFSLPQKYLSHHHMYNYQITLPNTDTCMGGVESINGLISIQYLKNIVIWNPTMRQHVIIPKPINWIMSSAFGYDPIDDTYKLFIIPYTNNYRTQVLTLGAQESWRMIKYSYMHRYRTCSRHLCMSLNYYNGQTDKIAMNYILNKYKNKISDTYYRLELTKTQVCGGEMLSLILKSLIARSVTVLCN